MREAKGRTKENSVSNDDARRRSQTKLLSTIKGDLVDGLNQAHPRMKDDSRLWRFVRGYKYDRANATDVLRKTLNWRRTHYVDAIADRLVNEKLTPKSFPFSKYASKLYPMIDLPDMAVDKSGHLLWIARLGQIDTAPLKNNAITMNDLEEYLAYRYEHQARRLSEYTRKTNRIQLFYIVIDLEGLGMGHTSSWCRETFKKVSGMLSANYVEFSYKITIINAPRLFQWVWTAIKPFLPERTVKKISIEGAEYQAKLLEDIGADHLPVAFGGKCVLKGATEDDTGDNGDDDDATYDPFDSKLTVKLTVGAGKLSEKISSLTLKGGEFARWRLLVENGKDIDLILRFSSTSSDKTCDTETKMSSLVSSSGIFRAPRDGVLSLVFDNTRAWVQSRTLKSLVTRGLE